MKKEIEHLLRQLEDALEARLADPLLRLSPREHEVCRLIRGGSRGREISRELGISPKTVEHHRKNIRRKLNLSNRKINLASYLRLIARPSWRSARGQRGRNHSGGRIQPRGAEEAYNRKESRDVRVFSADCFDTPFR